MRGVKNSLSLASPQSGVSLTEAILNDYLQLVWDNGSEVNAIYCPMYMKRKISGFTAGSTKNIDAEDKRLVNCVDIYEADAASVVKLFAHRYVTVSGDTNYDVVGVNEEALQIDWLRRPFDREIARTGDSTKGEVVGECTFVCKNPNAGFVLSAVL